jgi:MFS family permease
LLRFSTLLLVVGIALPLFAWSLPSLAVLAFLAGVPIAPVVMSAYGLVDVVAKRGTAAEAFAWITTAVFVGFSVGMALGGTLIDAFGVRASFAFAVAAMSVGAILVAAGPGLEET